MDEWWRFLRGDLSDTARVWAAVSPAIVIALWTAIGFVIYSVRRGKRGPFHDPEVEARGATLLLGMRVRLFFTWQMAPIWRVLLRAKVPANAVTLLSLLLGVGAGVAVAFGRFSLGGWLYLATGLCDFLDGRLARESGAAGPRGAVLDAVVDRYTEGALLVGLVWFYRESAWTVVTVLALTGSFLVPYVRARGEAAGATLHNVGLMQRPERTVLLGFATALAPAIDAAVPLPADWPAHSMTLCALVLVAAATHLTTVQRLVHVLRALAAARQPAGSGAVLGTVATPTLLPVNTWPMSFGWRRAMALLFEVGALGSLVLLELPWSLSAFAACAVATALATARGDRYRRVFIALSTAALVAGGVELLTVTDIAPAIAWLLARPSVQIAWVVPIELPRQVIERGPSESTHR